MAAQRADSSARVSVRVESEGLPLAHAVVHGETTAAETNAAGLARLTLPAGSHLVRVTLLGYAPDSALVVVAGGRDTTVHFILTAIPAELSGIVVTSARGAQRIESEPLRVEVLAGDDVAEKTEMRPSDLTKFLTEMAGIRVQQLSAATGASAVRMQGLRPRYTLLLADGLPLYGGSGSGLDLLQLPPADLRQIEVVKGPASALYGPSALGGMINLISKRPGHEGDLLVQGTSERGSNLFGWSSRQVSDAWGYTAVTGAHVQDMRDMDGDGWADIPRVRRVEARPRVFIDWPSGRSMFITAGGTAEHRDGGIVPGRVGPNGSAYAESAVTRRGDVGIVAHRLTGAHGMVQLRSAVNVDDKDKTFGGASERVRRSTGFGELSYSNSSGTHDVLAGLSIELDRARVAEYSPIDFNFTTASGFAQDAWRVTERTSLTASARLDNHSRYGPFVSPRISMLRQLRKGWTARLSGTRGFYAPTPFVEEAEGLGVRRVRGFESLGVETADYGAFDVNGREGPMELNATAFASTVHHQVTSELDDSDGTIKVGNSLADATARGVELFGVYDHEPLFITALYTFTEAREPLDAARDATRPAAYLPRHAGGVDITWEDAAHGTWIALEAFYTGKQPLDRDPFRSTGANYTVVGLLATQRVGRYKLFANVENLTDARQTRFEPLLLPVPRATGEWTTPVWGPLEGRVYSVGLRISAGSH